MWFAYRRLGLATRDLSDYLPLRCTRSKMEKQQIDGMDASLETLMEEALNKKCKEKRKKFKEMLGK